ncbi:MAG: hypothetical protein J6T10_10695 [Methanobrevibacter sp.]|nr:hypothetical protein [Methanobrevibacter sp.]
MKNKFYLIVLVLLILSLAACARVIEPAEEPVEEIPTEEPPVEEPPVVDPPVVEKNELEQEMTIESCSYLSIHEYEVIDVLEDSFFRFNLWRAGDYPFEPKTTAAGCYINIPTMFKYENEKIIMEYKEWGTDEEKTREVSFEQIFVGGKYLYYLEEFSHFKYENILVMPKVLYDALVEFYHLGGK